MVTLPQNPTFAQLIAFKLASRATKKAREAQAITRMRVILLYTIRLLAQIVGLSCWTLAGFSVSTTAGLIAATIACFVLSWLVTSPPQSTEDRMTTFERMNREQ